MTFAYTAANDRGEIINGELETTDIKAVVNYLNRQELTVISVKPRKRISGKLERFYFLNLSDTDKIMLTKHLATIVKAGVSLKEGVETILNDTKKRTLKKILTEAKFNLEKGQPLSVTFKKYPQFFSSVFTALLEAGEASGTLEKSLEYLGLQMSKEYKMKQKIKSAMIYPLVLIVAAAAVITILVVFVVPKLTKVFSQSKTDLPWNTKLVISVSNTVSANFYLILSSAIVIISLFLYFRKSMAFKHIFSRIIFKTPLLSDLYAKIILARFARTFGTLLSSGINVLKALDITSEVAGSEKYRSAFLEIRTNVSKGTSIASALKRRQDIFPYLFTSMINVGEKAGKLDSIMEELADFYEEEVDNSLKNLVSLVEPALILIMGIIVAFIAFSVIMPIYQLVGSV